MTSVVDERDLSEESRLLYEDYARRAVDSLKRNSINAQYFNTREEALARVLELVPDGVSVGWGDSVTLHQVGVFERLLERGTNTILDPFERNDQGYHVKSRAEDEELTRRALLTEVFLSGTNALTLDGKLVSTDMRGNRIAGMIWGPKKVIVVAGANKIVRNVSEAVERVKRVATPLNGKRHWLKHHHERFKELSCVKTGQCAGMTGGREVRWPDCKTPSRMCLKTVIIEGEQDPGRMHVIIVTESLGL